MRMPINPEYFEDSVNALARTWNLRHRQGIKKIRLNPMKRGELYTARLLREENATIYPVIVMQTDNLNKVGFPSTIIVPCTDDGVGDSLLREKLPSSIRYQGKQLNCMVDAVRMLNNVRFIEKIGTVPKKTMLRIEKKLKLLISGGVR